MKDHGFVWWNLSGDNARKPKKYLYEVGNEYLRKVIFACEECGESMWGYEYSEEEDKCYCPECAFRKGLINGQEYVAMEYYWAPYETARAEIVDGEIYVAFDNEKFPWEMSNRDYRKSNEYKDWRISVFERDGYKCQICGKVGGTLNAHHIKHFKDYPNLWFNLDNGITLCEECHREVHRKERREKNGKDR